MYTNNRDAYRQAFFIAWEKYQKQQPLEAVELQIIEVILAHPEYHHLLSKQYEQQEFSLEENPFFHMSLHIAVKEQLKMDRPQGIKAIYQDLLAKYEHAHQVEHIMIDCLAQTLWQSQQTGQAPKEEDYLQALKTAL